jgi:tetratricopeptide (TPR) repeat protein
MANFWKGRAPLLAALLVFFCAGSYAQTTIPYTEVHTVGDTAHAVVEHSFDISVAGTYQVTLVDFGAALTPTAPLASVELAVTEGSSIVGTPLTAAGNLQFTATGASTYVVHVVGVPGQVPGSGPIGIQVTSVPGNATIASFSDTLALPSTALPSNESTLDDTFTATSTGNYVVTLTDLQLPQALTTLTLNVTTEDGTYVTNPPLAAAGSATVALQQGVSYRIFAVGLADSTVNAGLYSAVVAPSGGGAPIYSKVIPVGTVAPAQSATLTAGTSYTLSLTDLKVPSALSEARALITLNGQLAAQLIAPGTSPAFPASSGTYQVFTLASTGTTGSYAVAVTPQGGGAAALSFARAVSAPGGAVSVYSFDTSVTTAGSYNFDVADFGIPNPLAALSAVAVQAGAPLGTPLKAAGTASVTAAAGPVSLLVFAQAATSGGLFDIDLTPAAGGTPVFETTQGVGQLFSARQLSITTPGNYAVNVSDLSFPGALATFAVIVTQGSSKVGSIFGGGAFGFPAATAGNYFVNFIAQPGATDGAGTYALSATAAPDITLTSSAMSVASGGTVTLTWSSQNATGCTASGGWSGTQAVTGGTFTSAALTAQTTFTLTCTGEGVSEKQDVTVSVDTTPAKSGGGGGSVSGDLLFALLVAVAIKLSFRRQNRNAALCVMVAMSCIALISGCGGAQSRLASHLQRGQAYFDEGNYAKASIEFRNAMQIAPKDEKARLMAGSAAEHLGHVREALGLYQSVVDSSPLNAEASADLARVLIYGGASQRALDVIQPALARHPDDPVLLTLRAAAQLVLDKPAEAVADADRALKLAPTNEEAIEVRARIYRKAGDMAGATALVTAAVQRSPTSKSLREVLADIYLVANQLEQAEQQLRELVVLAPHDSGYRYQLASFYARGHKLDQAQRVLEDAVKALPDDAQIKLTLVDFISTQRTRAQGEKVLRDFIAREPQNYDLQLGLGALLQRSGALSDATKVYGEVIQKEGTEPKGLVARDRVAGIDFAQGRIQDARNLLEEVLKKNPRDTDALLLRSRIALARNEPAGAIVDLRAVVRDQPQSAGVRQLLARAYLANGEPALAEEALHSAIDLAPTDTSLRVELAQLLIRTQKVDAAVSLLEQTVRAAPEDVAVRDALAHAYLEKRDYVAAGKAAEDLQTLRPKSAEGFYLAGLVAQGQNRLDDAQREFERALAVEPQVLDALSALAHLELARGQGTKALALVKSAVENQPPNAFSLNLLGELYLTQKDVASADDAFTRAIKLGPNWWVPYRSLAASRYSAKDTAGAIAAYQSGIKAVPTEQELVVELATLYQRLDRVDDAIACYETAYRQNPYAQQVANNLAMLLVTYKSDRGSLDQARDMTAGFSSSSDGNLLDTNGWVHFKREEFAQALQVLERAAERSPDSKEIRYHLGMAELRAGMKDRARNDLQSALSGAARFSGADEARAQLAALKGQAATG